MEDAPSPLAHLVCSLMAGERVWEEQRGKFCIFFPDNAEVGTTSFLVNRQVFAKDETLGILVFFLARQACGQTGFP